MDTYIFEIIKQARFNINIEHLNLKCFITGWYMKWDLRKRQLWKDKKGLVLHSWCSFRLLKTSLLSNKFAIFINLK